MSDEEKVTGIFNQLASKASRSVKNLFNVETIVTCKFCGEYVRQGDTASRCGTHPKLDIDADSFLVKIGIVASPKQIDPPKKSFLPASHRPSEERVTFAGNEIPEEKPKPKSASTRPLVSLEGGYKRPDPIDEPRDDFQRKLAQHYVPYETSDHIDDFTDFDDDNPTYSTREG